MHAIRQYEFGAPGTLRYEQVDDPHPARGQVRIKVAAAGVHLIDTSIRAGRAMGAFPLPDLPMIPGREVAGTVDELGPDVEGRWLGTDVVAHLGMASSGYAELALADVTALHSRPSGLTPEAAVAMVGTGRMTMGLLAVAELKPDDIVLVTSAAGGIGTLLVQAARAVGATVIGVAGGPAKVRRVLLNGASIVADYRRAGWAGAVREQLYGRAVTVVFDGVGGTVGPAALDLLEPGGRMIVFGWSGGKTPEQETRRDVTVEQALGPRLTNLPGGLRALEEQALAEAAAGRLVPAVQTFALKDAAAAHRALETRASSGKVVLLP